MKTPGLFSCPMALAAAASACFVLAARAAALPPRPPLGNTDIKAPRLWKPVADEVYLQEIGAKIATDKPVTSVAVHSNTVYMVVGGDLKMLQDAALADSAGAPKGVRRLRSLGGALWAASDEGTYRLAGSAWERIDTRRFTDFCLHLGQVYGATRDELFRFE